MMEGMKLYLEGPGRECRPVTLFSIEATYLGAMSFPFRGQTDEPFEINVMTDSDGNLARQTDREGLRYKFNGSELPWSLMVA